MAGITISLLPQATVPLTGSELIIVEQGGVTKKSTINAGQQIALDAANAAQTTANTALANANAAQIDADAAQTAANNAQSTADSKLSTVAVDGVTITGNGTSGSPLAANVPTLYQQLTKSAFLALVAGDDLVAGQSYLVEDAYDSQIWAGLSFTILVTANTNNTINNLSWIDYPNGNPTASVFLKCITDALFSFLRVQETSTQLFLNQAACQLVNAGYPEIASSCVVYPYIGGAFLRTTTGLNSLITKNVINIDNASPNFGLLGEIDINADTFTPYPPSYQEITKSDFADLVLAHALVAGASYLVTDAYISSVYSRAFPILVTAISSTDISELTWVKYVYGSGLPQYDNFVKCRTDVSFSFLTFYEMTAFMYLDQTQCLSLSVNNEFAAGCIMFVLIGGKICKTSMSDALGIIVTKNVMSLTDNGILGNIDISANTFTPYTASSYVGYKSYVAILNQIGSGAPVPTLMVDEISGATTAIYFDRTGTGTYRAIKFGAFTVGKTTKIIQNNSAFVTTLLAQSGADAILIYTYSSLGVLADSCLSDATFEIRVYN